MKKALTGIGIASILLLGLALVLYPDISNWLAERDHFSAIQEYGVTVADMTAQAMEAERRKAQAYNDTLSGAPVLDPFTPGSGASLSENYRNILNIKGIMGLIDIPKINVNLPIHHSTDESVLRKGVGHLENTSFPIGGQGCHAVLTGHSGLSSSRLFTDLRQLEIGDAFYLHVLGEILAYQVDQILVVEPDDASSLTPIAGEDLVTLITCTPYGINSHRLLVRGARVPDDPGTGEAETAQTPTVVNWRAVIIAAFALCLGIALGVHRRRSRADKRKRRGGK